MELKEAISERLVLIDEYLSAAEIPVPQRITQAAVMFVQDWIIEIEGDDQTDFALKPWFAVIYHHVKEWYRDHYGPATEGNGSSIASGVVIVRGMSVEVKVPLTRSTVETPGETAWLHFPVTIDEGENPEDWLVDPPPLTKLDTPERKKLAKKLAEVGTGLRRIHTNLMGIKPSDDTVNGLLKGIQREFESAAANILRKEASGRGAVNRRGIRTPFSG